MAQYPLIGPLETTPRADFDAEQFRKMLWGHGTRFRWEQAELCPCSLDKKISSPRVDCPVCGGRGWHYADSQEVRAIISGVKDAPKIFEEYGTYGFAMANLSLPWEWTPGFHDRFTLLDGFMFRQEIVEHKATVDRLTFPVLSVSMELYPGGLPAQVERSVRYLRVMAADGTGGPVRELGVDFVVDSEGRIDWTLGEGLGTAPVIGEPYAVSYYFAPRWVVAEHKFALRQTDAQTETIEQVHQPLPVAVECKLDWWGVAPEYEAP